MKSTAIEPDEDGWKYGEVCEDFAVLCIHGAPDRESSVICADRRHSLEASMRRLCGGCIGYVVFLGIKSGEEGSPELLRFIPLSLAI
jgi:hypothetical protein